MVRTSVHESSILHGPQVAVGAPRIAGGGGSATAKVMIVIPARLESQRLPRKLLLRDTGKPLIQHTYEAARRSRYAESVVVACDSPLIADEVERFGGRAALTSPQATCGTERVAELAAACPAGSILVNLQGDEPEVEPDQLDLVIRLLIDHPRVEMATLAAPIRSREELEDPACVKVVRDNSGRALYFSRSPIPHPREWDDALLASGQNHFLRHIGLYAYRREFLLELPRLPEPGIERLERLEQLRVLAAGYSIQVGIVPQAARGIDTLADYQAFVNRCRSR